MFTRLFGHLWEKRRRKRSDLAGRIFAILERHGSLTLDDQAVRALSCGRREVTLMACYLAVRERAHLLSDDKGCLVIVSNAEYDRRLESESMMILDLEETPHLEYPPAPPRPASGKTSRLPCTLMVDVPGDGDDIAGAVRESRVMRPKIDIPVVVSPTGVIPFDGDAGWHTVDAAPVETPREENLPTRRQSLPDRPREPWGAQETLEREW